MVLILAFSISVSNKRMNFTRKDQLERYLHDVTKITIGYLIIMSFHSVIQTVCNISHAQLPRSYLSQSELWYRISQQDKDPMYAMQHCDYAITYFNAAIEADRDSYLQKSSNLDLNKYNRKLLAHQSGVSRTLLQKYGKSSTKVSP